MTRTPSAARDRTRLLLGCGSAALALALATGPTAAGAQGIQADGVVTSGLANITTVDPTTTRVDITSQNAVIDWTPLEDGNGNALDFLRTGSTAIFQSSNNGFAVLNRILPATNNNIAVIDGTVIGQLGDLSNGFTPGGFVAFYSPTGMLVGNNANFDVGRLMLTTLDISNESFNFFASGGFATFFGESGSRATITISPGARITALPQNAFFAVVAADVEMRGSAYVNGAHAYVAGEVVSMRFSNGLFDISVPVGTAASGEVVTLAGNIGGPASTGLGDNRMVYGVASAAQDPISMLLSGNIGFDTAQSADIINGEIILAANYNVSQRNVAGASIRDDIGSVRFSRNAATSDLRADITMRDFTATSSLLAIGTGDVLATGAVANSAVTGNLTLVGGTGAGIEAQAGRTLSVSGEVLLDARDYGVIGSGLQSLDAINAQGGTARILANGADSLVSIGGRAIVTAEAFGGLDIISSTAGTATGGTAEILADAGRVSIGGDASVRASAFGTTFFPVDNGADARGGTARVVASNGGQASLGGSLELLADATAAEGETFGASTPSNAYGGTARLGIDGLGSIGIATTATVGASASASAANAAGTGGLADAGEASVVLDGDNLLAIGSDLTMRATATGGTNAGGIGGIALGGIARASVGGGGFLSVSGDLVAESWARGGSGLGGGDALAGIGGARVLAGTLEITGGVAVDASGRGGSADFGAGGNGGTGRGGTALFQAEGNALAGARIAISGDVDLRADGSGGTGGASDGDFIAAGRGGDGWGGDAASANQADSAFGGGAYLLADGDYGEIFVSGISTVSAIAFGGSGGSASGFFDPGAGGDATGGTARAGLALFGGPGTVRGGTASFAGLSVNAFAFGGSGGINLDELPIGFGGTGQGGEAVLSVQAGTVLTGAVTISASGQGGSGGNGGSGLGGIATVEGGAGGLLDASFLVLEATALGGFGYAGTGGSAVGGKAAFTLDGMAATFSGDLFLDASARGEGSFSGEGGDGQGGEAFVATLNPNAQGSLAVAGHTTIFANGSGAASQLSFFASNSLGANDPMSGPSPLLPPVPTFSVGTGRGGTAYIQALGGSSVTLGTAQVAAIGQGGSAFDRRGGDGIGGTVRLTASGSGSTITIQRNLNTGLASDSVAGGALLNADGLATDATGDTGVGGFGQGGTISLVARGGGSILLPADPQSDPDSVGAIAFSARGFGGGSSVAGGIGGTGVGGFGEIEVDGQGSRITMGDAELSVFAQGGSSLDQSLDISGGTAIGGRRTIRVLNGGSLGFGTFDSTASARGGNGSGAGDGGSATTGGGSLVLTNGTLGATGVIALVDETTGGTGRRGGDVFAGEGGGIEFTATGSTINLAPGPRGFRGIALEAIATGGAGTESGGSATSGPVRFAMLETDLTGAIVRLRSAAIGGAASAPDGIGGAANAGRVDVTLSNATLGVEGELLIASDAIGGDADLSAGVGGGATAGVVDLQMTGGSLTIGAAGGGLDNLLLRSQAQGGRGLTVGQATSQQSSLALNGGQLTADQVLIQSDASASLGPDGTAIAGASLFDIAGASVVTVRRIGMSASAGAFRNGRVEAGVLTFRTAAGSTAQVNASEIALAGTVSNPGAGASQLSGQAIVEIAGGSVNTADFVLTLPLPGGTARQSRIAADGGNLNVTGLFSVSVPGDLELRTGQGGVIGSTSPSSTTRIEVDARGTIQTLGDGSTGSGLVGQSIALNAGRSLLIGGNLITRNGPVNLNANLGGAPALANPVPVAITMAQGALIDAGTGKVTLRLNNGGSDPQQAGGAITLASITGGSIDVRNLADGTGTDIRVRADGVLTASGAGRAIDLASLEGEVVNLAGDGGLVLTGGGHYAIFAATPTGSQIGSFANYARRYNVANSEVYDQLNPGGNFAAFRIVPFLTVTPEAVSRFYGSANPAFTARFTGFLPGDGPANLAGTPLFSTLATTSSGIGDYTILATLGSLLSEQGYQFNFNPGTLTIDPRPLTVTADNLTRLYGNANPALTFTVGGLGLVNGDQLTGALATTAGATTGVGNVAITQGTLAANANYALTFVNGQLTINPRPLTITADALSRIYGNANPALTFGVGGLGLVNGDQLTGALATSATATSGVGDYAITLGSLTAGNNYAITYNGANLTITPRAITVTADALSRIYGNANPLLTYTVGGLGLVNGDQLSGTLATSATATSSIGAYGITLGSLTGGNNYAISYTGANLTVTARPITITADALSRVYGNANPALTYTVGGLGLVNGDQLTGTLATSATTTSGIGAYGITLGSLAASANYAVTYNGANLTITPRPITITADAMSRIYGNANPALTYSVGGLGLVNGDQLTGSLATSATTASGIGAYGITLGSLAASANYAVTYNGANLTITPRPITITADALSRIYGNANPALTYTVGGLGLVNGDQLTGTLATSATTSSGIGAYAITLGSLTPGANYTVTYAGANLTITPRPLTITAENLSKLAGLADPALTYTLGELGLVNGDQLTGGLVRDPGERGGTYAIRQGTLAASANYAVTYVPGTFTIDVPPAPPEVINPVAIEAPLAEGETPPEVNESDEERLFGPDFPSQPDTPLITEDKLLDDPVASGGDASITGGSSPTTPPIGGQ